MYYLNARYYLPSVGRFINRDSFQGFEDDPASLNQYSYCGNNPVMYVDPSGHYWDNAWWNAQWFVSNAINAAIALIIGGGISAFSKYAKTLANRYSFERAAIMFADSLKRKLLAKGISWSIASWAGKAVVLGFTIIMWATDPGRKIFNLIDSRDYRPNNGYLNL